MIYLNPTSSSNACNIHCKKLKKKIIPRIEKRAYGMPGYIKKFITENIDKILKGSPAELMNIYDDYKELLSKKHVTKSSTKKRNDAYFVRVFDYDNFINKKKRDYDAYDLAENLSIKTCAYCNRSHTVTVINSTKSQKYTRPQFDHYFAKSIFPILALSFHNLIPSCSICNSTLKGKEEFDLETYLHPYVDNINSAFKFSFIPRNTATLKAAGSDLEVICINEKTTGKSLANKINKTFNLFKIKEIYSAHASEITDLIRIKEVMSDKYLEILRETYDLKISEDELYRLAFGVYREEDKFQERPFSKLKKDILRELGII